MEIDRVELSDFRNYRTLSLTPSPQLNVLAGLNAQGKTNLLEGLGVLLVGRSFRGSRAADMLAWGESAASVSGEIRRGDTARAIRRRIVQREDGRWGVVGEGCVWARAIGFGWPDLGILTEGPQARRNLWDLLGGLNDSGRTVVLTTHYMDEAEALCDRVAIMDHGRVLQLDTPAALVRGLDAPVHIWVAPHRLTPTQAAAIPGVGKTDDDGSSTVVSTREPSQVLTRLAELDALEGLRVKGATLEDVFLSLTGREYRA